MKIQNEICQAIEILVQQALAKAEFDKTIRATIKQCDNADTRCYKCNYQDSIITAYADNGMKYQSGETVYILIPCNNMSGRKIILGCVDSTHNFDE